MSTNSTIEWTEARPPKARGRELDGRTWDEYPRSTLLTRQREAARPPDEGGRVRCCPYLGQTLA